MPEQQVRIPEPPLGFRGNTAKGSRMDAWRHGWKTGHASRDDEVGRLRGLLAEVFEYASLAHSYHHEECHDPKCQWDYDLGPRAKAALKETP